MSIRTKAIWAMSTLAVGACTGLGNSDPFSYSQHIDEFDGLRVSEAMTEVVGDNDPNEKVQITLNCRVDRNDDVQRAIGPGDTKLNLLFLDKKGQPSEFSNLQLKFDAEDPSDIDWLMKQDESKNINEFAISYVMAGLLMFPEAERGRMGAELFTAAFSSALGGILGQSGSGNRESENLKGHIDKIFREFGPRIMGAKSLMVRYQSQSGAINTIKLAIDSGNYRKVLQDCGWDKTKNRASGTAAERSLEPTQAADSEIEASGSASQIDDRTRNAAAAALKDIGVPSAEAT